MSQLSVYFFSLLFTLPAYAAQAKYGPNITLLSRSHQYIQTHPAPDYWALSPYYLPQQDERSCSVASMAMLVNAARTHEALSASDELVTQSSILKKVSPKGSGDVWSKGVGSGGHGVTLDQLKEIAERSLKAYGFDQATVEVFHFSDSSPVQLKKLREILSVNEKSDHDFVVANFDQGIFTGDTSAGHIAPVGAYDSSKHRVLIMDPDRQWYEPYWVSDEVFLKGMATQDSEASKPRGLIWVRKGN